MRKHYIAVTAMLLGLIVAVSVGIYVGIHPSDANESIESAPAATVNATASNQMHLYSLKSEVEVLSQPEAYTSMPAVFLAPNPGPFYLVKERRNGFVRVTNTVSSSSEATGWIPEWYLRTDETSAQAEKVEPYEMIVALAATFRLYPDEPEPSGFELEPGKVVQVTSQYGDWLRVNIMTYDSPYTGDKWVPASALIPWDPAKAKEGILRPSASVYNENGEVIDGPHAINPIIIQGEEEGRYRIGAPGGYSGLIDKADFMPGPFLKIIDQ